MKEKILLLSSENFENNTATAFRQLWNDQDFADVTLVTVDDQQIRAHKAILSLCSQFFRKMLLNNTQKNMFYLKDLRYKELEIVLKLIYLGQCDVGEFGLKDYLAAVKFLELRDLTEHVNIKPSKEVIVDNLAQETKDLYSSNTDIDNSTNYVSTQDKESEDTQTANHQDKGSLGERPAQQSCSLTSPRMLPEAPHPKS